MKRILPFIFVLLLLPVLFFLLFQKEPVDIAIKEKPLYNFSGDYLNRPGASELSIEGARDARIILYRSRARPASGILLLPEGDFSKKPLLLFQHGMIGVADKCAPSNVDPSILPFLFFYRDAFIKWLRAGYAIAMPDDPGLGTPGRYRLGVAKAQALGAYDMFQAVRREYGFSDYINLGHSQGGQGSMKLSEIPQIKKPLANIAYAPAAFFKAQAKVGSAILSRPSQGAALLFLLLRSATLEAGVDPRAVFSEEVFSGQMDKNGLSLWQRAERECLSELVYSFTRSNALVARDLLKTRNWKEENMKKIEAVLENMETGAENVLIIQGGRDDIVFPEVTSKLTARLGSQVTYKVFPEARHQNIVVVSSGYVLDYINQKISGRGDSSG